MPYSAYCLFFVPPNKRLDPVLRSIGKWLIRHDQNVDAMVLASALMRGIHPPDNVQNGGRPPATRAQ